jgi:CO dehydrogenase maturation factor
MMKLLISGKGGSGKSTVAAMTALALNARGFRVTVVDMDESNVCLHRLLGLNYPMTMLDGLGGKNGLRDKTKPSLSGQSQMEDMFKPPLHIDDLPGEWIAESNGIRLLTIGKIEMFGEGCACPMGGLARMLLSSLQTGDKEAIIIDTSAGVEHFGRGIDRLADAVIGVVDPSFESLALAGRLLKLAGEARTAIYFVFNKMDDSVEKIMEELFSPGRIIARMAFDAGVFAAGLIGEPLKGDFPQAEPICRLVADYS